MIRWILLFFIVATVAFAEGPETSQILKQMMSATKPFIAVIGDSLTSTSRFPEEICGFPVLNAGISGSRASTFISLAEDMTAAKVNAKLIVVALGINDTLGVYRTDFASSYRLLIDSLPKVPIAIATLAPIDHSMSDGSRVNLSRMAMVNLNIRTVALYRQATLIELSAMALREFDTVDGIHPTPRSRPIWDDAITHGIKSALKCD